jgi:hypothetical protein
LGGVAAEGAACESSGLVGRAQNGQLLSCQSGVWKGNDGAPGQTCGFSSQDHQAGHINIFPCQGRDPMYGCPAGYSTITVFQADENYLYTCYKR